MSQHQLFLTLVVTVVLTAGGIREIVSRDNVGLGVFMIAIPGCFWLSRLIGDLP
jgi:hypothetical protein